MKKYSILVFLALLFFVSCGKEESLSKTDLLTHKPWLLVSSIYNPPMPQEGGSIVNRIANWPECYKDDLYYYTSGGTYRLTEGATQCSEFDYGVLEVGVWAFNEDESKLYKGIFELLDEFDIVKLDGNELQLRLILADTLQNVYTLTETFRHP
ncbi:MAG: hypothetical protein R6W78_07075 [Bacteroidales bacterium]